MEREEMRKGPWTEQEDCQLIFYVKLFGDRRWDFIAKVSGLKRTGKSCRLRWVNYLHPGLKRDKMTPHEERLVVDLQSKWGNRWSRIARKLPGRTDNEIKNYWRTHMRKEAQERKKKKGSSSSSSASASASSSSSSSNSSAEEEQEQEQERSFYDTSGVEDLILADAVNATAAGGGEKKSGLGLEVEEGSKVYSMDDIWKEFEFTEGLTSHTVASPVWDDYCTTDSLWCINIEEESKMLMQQPMGDHHFQSFPFCNNMIG